LSTPTISQIREGTGKTHLLQSLLTESATHHRHLCPRQVLGVRIGLYGLQLLGILDEQVPIRYRNDRKQLLTIVETDGCGADGVSVATGCWVGHRTLRVLDYGKVAATLVNTKSGQAVRISPRPNIRQISSTYASNARSRWHAYLEAYQIMPDDLLLSSQQVILNQPLAQILSRPNAKVICEECKEEVMNEREVMVNGRVLCQPCAGDTYFFLK
jgi:formylmethanofuran dehydrogenase subunit E